MEFIDEVMQEAKEIASRSPSSPTYTLYKLAESFYNRLNSMPNEASKLDVEQVILFLISGLFVGTPTLNKIMERRVEIFEKIVSST
jgi:hypothetical protein